MEKLIARVTAASGRAPLTRLITAPLGLDVWEVQPDHLVDGLGAVIASGRSPTGRQLPGDRT